MTLILERGGVFNGWLVYMCCREKVRPEYGQRRERGRERGRQRVLYELVVVVE
jgi:hypothetical protein